MAKQLKFKNGDKIVFGRGAGNKGNEGITIGKIYSVTVNSGFATFLDDDNDRRTSPLDMSSGMKPTKIVE